MNRPLRRNRAGAADRLQARLREARALVLGRDRLGAALLCLEALDEFAVAMDPDGLEDLERSLAHLAADMRDLGRGIVAEWLIPHGPRKKHPPLPSEEWVMKRAPLAAALSRWGALSKGRQINAGAVVIARAVFGDARSKELANCIVSWRKDFERGRAPKDGLQAYRYHCDWFHEQDISKEDLPHVVRIGLSNDLTRDRSIKELSGQHDPRMAAR
jgi:hypothetical protein